MTGRIRQCTAQMTEKPIATLSKLRFSMFFMIAIIFKYKEYVKTYLKTSFIAAITSSGVSSWTKCPACVVTTLA